MNVKAKIEKTSLHLLKPALIFCFLITLLLLLNGHIASFAYPLLIWSVIYFILIVAALIVFNNIESSAKAAIPSLIIVVSIIWIFVAIRHYNLAAMSLFINTNVIKGLTIIVGLSSVFSGVLILKELFKNTRG